MWQQEQLEQLQAEATIEAMREERLKDQLRAADSAGFREREARRRFGYVRPGTRRFVADEPWAGYPGVEPAFAPVDPNEALDKDWGNFGN